jgi:hypothetical protein
MGLKTKYVLSTSTLKEPIEFNMMMLTIRINSFGEKKNKTFFLIVFLIYFLVGLLKCQV